MLKNIRLHIEKDEEKQVALEEKLAKHISITQKDNINAFQRYIPSLLSYVKRAKSQNISIFCNKYSRFNIVDYGVGRVFYGFEPEQEISSQVETFRKHSLYVAIAPELQRIHSEAGENPSGLHNLSAYKHHMGNGPFSDECECLVVLGIGLGQHIKQLIEISNIKHLIIYEPELQYFNCSVMVTPWREILELAKQKGTAIYLQLERDGRDLINDIVELGESFAVKRFYLYQHYHHPVFNSLYKAFNQNSWSTLVDKGISFKMHEQSDEYCPLWTPPIMLEQYDNVDTTAQRFQDNLTAFKHYFPKIHKEFADYQPKKWLPVSNSTGQINIINMDNLTSWYSDDPSDDCIFNFDNYSEQPNKDGLVLGYTGEKLKHYIHYKFVKETEELLKDIEEEQGALPSTIKSLIMFGLGVGYQIEHLMSKHKVEKLFICEPNRDFFYASLFAIDWAQIIQTIDQQEGRLYINIGDDGTNLFRDLLNQFYSIGPYILNQTYFYQSYYNAALSHSISQLREQLQIVISMGEYFDHARYGIAHTKEAFMREYPHMVKGAATKLSFDDKEVPVFLVGNGPSLDNAIQAIIQWQDRAIIVSCGTSLHTLYKNAIIPDFHAEIEQNRTTFDWAARIGDFDYLKSVSLISCNGIHPDTCELYKDVLIAFKEGESSTVSTLNVLGQNNYEALKFSFPTVSNFALNFFIKLGFKQLYLFGVDLGFTDNTKHHSVQSGYYDDKGSPLYDYAEKNNTSLIAQGNFRKTVFTKQEFKIAKIIMEQSFAASQIECYNTSDGVRIVGSLPLHTDEILLLSTPEQKQECIIRLRERCFARHCKDSFVSKYEDMFSKATLNKELSMFKKRLEQYVENFEQAELLIESQKRMLFASYQQGRSLLFYFLYGTVNYANVVMNKVAYSFAGGGFSESKFNQVRVMWLSSFAKISSALHDRSFDFDASSTFPAERMISCIRRTLKNKRVLILSDSKVIDNAIDTLITSWSCGCNYTCVKQTDFVDSYDEYSNKFDYVIYYANDDFENRFNNVENIFCQFFANADIFCVTNQLISQACLSRAKDNVCFMSFPGDFLDISQPPQCNTLERVSLSILYLTDIRRFTLLIPKYTLSENVSIDDLIDFEDYAETNFYDLNIVVGSSKKNLNIDQSLMNNGTRPMYLGVGLSPEKLCLSYVTDKAIEKRKKHFLEVHNYLVDDTYV